MIRRQADLIESKDSWFESYPVGWKAKLLKYLVQNVNNKSDTQEANFKIALENIESFTGKHLESNDSQTFDGVGKHFTEDDVLFNKLRPYLAKVYAPQEAGTCVSELLVLRTNPEIDKGFLFWRLLSHDFINVVDSSTYGAKMPRANWEFIGNLSIPYPSIDEQHSIASFLDRKTQQIDDLISKKRRLIQLLEEEKTAVINRAVTKGLDPDVPMRESGIPWLGKIPAHWKIKKLKYIAISVQTGNTPPTKKEEYFFGNLDWFTPSDIGLHLYLKDSKRKISLNAVKDGVAKIFSANSVLMVGIGATLGKVGLIEHPSSANQQINAITFENIWIAKFYLYFLLAKQDNIVSNANAATLSILNQSQTRDLLMPYLSIDEMKLIVEHTETSLKQFEKIQDIYHKEINLLLEYRIALINEAVTGKIDVRGEEGNRL